MEGRIGKIGTIFKMRSTSGLISSVICIVILSLTIEAASVPTLYLTYHGGSKGINTIHSFSLNGTFIEDVTNGSGNSVHLRSLLLQQNGQLFAVNADDDASRVILYSTCDSNGQRSYLGDFASTHLSHPYGIAQVSYNRFN